MNTRYCPAIMLLLCLSLFTGICFSIRADSLVSHPSIPKSDTSTQADEDRRQFRRFDYKAGTILQAVPFLRPGNELRLVWSPGLPRTAFERVERMVGKDPVVIRAPKDLVGIVCIDTAEKALQYVRLFSSPATVHGMAQPVWLEVIPRRAMDRNFLFGITQADSLTALQRTTEHHWSGDQGILANEDWDTQQLTSPIILRTTSGFTVIRLMFRPGKQGEQVSTAHWVADEVSQDGHVARKLIGTLTLTGIALYLVPEL